MDLKMCIDKEKCIKDKKNNTTIYLTNIKWIILF